MCIAMELVDCDAMDVDDEEPLSEIKSVDTNPSVGGTKIPTALQTSEDMELIAPRSMTKIQCSDRISLLEGALDRYTMEIILSYLTLIEYSRLSIASRIMKETVSTSTHLHMSEYSLFRKRKVNTVRTKDMIPEPTERELQPPSPSNPQLDYCDITPQKELKSLMHRFDNVRVLNLQGLAPVGDDVIDILNRCPSAPRLKSITLHSCALSYWCAHSFQLRNLEHLTLTGNSIRARMTFLLKDSKNLKSLTFKQCPALRDGDIAGISGILHGSLEELVVNHTKVSKPVASFPLLTRASFAGGFCLTSLSKFHCPSLKVLNLSFCVRLTERQIEQLVERSPLLETLILVKCAGVGSLDLESTSLRRLDAGFTHNMRELTLLCPALEQLDVSNEKSVAIKNSFRLNYSF